MVYWLSSYFHKVVLDTEVVKVAFQIIESHQAVLYCSVVCFLSFVNWYLNFYHQRLGLYITVLDSLRMNQTAKHFYQS